MTRKPSNRTIGLMTLFIMLLAVGLMLALKPKNLTREVSDSYVFKETVIERINAATSPDVPQVYEVVTSLADRGFQDCELTSAYDMNGAMQQDEALEPTSEDKHPLYNALYVTPEGRMWVVYVCNGSFMANPLFMYDPTKVPVLLVEEEWVTSYSSNANEFIRTVPDESELTVKRVQHIDAETLDGLDEEGVEAL